MKIEDNSVVRLHYTVSEPGVGQIESSREGSPISVLIGHGNIVPGLEDALRGHEAGDSFNASVGPEQGYGLRRDGMVQRVPRKHFKGARLVPGQQVVLPTPQGQRAMTIQKVGMSVVDVDLNHPMAGKNLHFAIEIVDVREASAEEVEHGHVHGEGGHQH